MWFLFDVQHQLRRGDIIKKIVKHINNWTQVELGRMELELKLDHGTNNMDFNSKLEELAMSTHGGLGISSNPLGTIGRLLT